MMLRAFWISVKLHIKQSYESYNHKKMTNISASKEKLWNRRALKILSRKFYVDRQEEHCAYTSNLESPPQTELHLAENLYCASLFGYLWPV